MGCTNNEEEKPSSQRAYNRRVTQSKNKDIRKNYEFISMLGNGSFGKVRLYRDKNFKELLFAIKTLKKEGISPYQFNLLKREVDILSNMDHPNIVKYFGIFEDDLFIHIIMEYLKGQDLSKIILFSDKKNLYTLKLIDFGLAANSDQEIKTVGTPSYMSPEMIDGNVTYVSDIWSVGVIVYQMITGDLPFKDDDNKTLYEKIKNGNYDTEILNEKDCSEEVKDFINKALQKDIKNRLTVDEALNHPWIKKFSINNLDQSLINEDSIKLFIQFSKRPALHKEIFYFFAKISNETDIVDYKNVFNSFDANNKGCLSKEDLKTGLEKNKIDIDEDTLDCIFKGLDFHNSGRISYSEFLAAMVSSKNFNKEEKIKSVFNLLRESEQNKDYITYDSLENAAKALNLNINRERIKLCFDKLNGHLSLEKFQKLIMNENFEDESIEPTSNNFNKIKRNLTYSFKQKS